MLNFIVGNLEVGGGDFLLRMIRIILGKTFFLLREGNTFGKGIIYLYLFFNGTCMIFP